MGHNFQSTDTKHTSNSRINSQGLGSISLIHSDLHRLLECILMVDKGDEGKDKDDNKEMNGKNKTYKRGEIDKTFVDFGCKYRLIVKYKGSEADKVDDGSAANDGPGPGPGSSPDVSSGSHATILMHIAVIGWETVKEQATERLVTIFGNDNVFLDELSSSISKNDSNANSKMQPIGTHSAFRVAKGYSICVRVHVDDTSTTSLEREAICSHLSNIRMTLLGSKLQDAFVSLANRNVEQQQSKDILKEPIFKIPIQRSPLVHTINGDNTNINHTNNKGQSQCQPSILVSCKSDRITVVTPFIFRPDKEVDCALAKLFLQQFEAAQRKSMKERHGKNVPICDYRRSSDPPLEVKRDQGIADGETECESESETEVATRTAPTTEQLLVHHAGFLSLTFLEHHVDTESKRAKVVSNVLMFVDYVDYHIKCSKSNMLSRMRTKKDALMRDLFEE